MSNTTISAKLASPAQLRYVTTLGIRFGNVPSKSQLQALTPQQCQQSIRWFNQRLGSLFAAGAAPAAHQQAALSAIAQALGVQVPQVTNAKAADAAIVAWAKRPSSTSAQVWAVAQAVAASQDPALQAHLAVSVQQDAEASPKA